MSNPDPEVEILLKWAIEPKWKKWALLVELFTYAFLGGWLAHLVSFPAPWLTGSLLAVSIAMFSGRQQALPDWFRDLGFALIGIILGSGFSPDTLQAITTWPISISILAVTVVAISWSAYMVLTRAGKWDHATALFAALPGALGYVLAIAEAAKADMQKVAVAQSVRLFALIAVLPVILTPFSEEGDGPLQPDAAIPSAVPDQTLDLASLGLLVLAVGLLAPIVKWLKVPAGVLLAGMFTSGGLYLSGVYHNPLPDWYTIPGFVMTGAIIGIRFGSVSLAALVNLSAISLLSLLTSLIISVVAAYACATMLGLPLGQVFLAFAPGGFETMVLLAFLFDQNPAYVAGHHLIRYLGLVIFAPIVTMRLTRAMRTKR